VKKTVCLSLLKQGYCFSSSFVAPLLLLLLLEQGNNNNNELAFGGEL
jgi:hypothetical protein